MLLFRKGKRLERAKKRSGVVSKIVFTVATFVCVTVDLLFASQRLTLPEGFEARFVQYVTNPDNKRLVYEGSVAFAAPSSIKWRYEKPTRKEVCSDGKMLQIVDYDLEQVSLYRMKKRLEFAEIVRSAVAKEKNIYVTRYEGKTYTLRVDEEGRLESLAYYDDLDNKVQISFKNMRYLRSPLPAASLECRHPKAFDVIRG